jgi:serine protease inhibitor
MLQHNQIPRTGTAVVVLLTAAMVLAACGGRSVSSAQNPPGSASNGSSIGGSGMPPAVAQARKADTPVDPAIVAADNAFGLRLLDTLLPGNGGENIAISPVSVAVALQILYNGAAGSTQQAMAQTLELGALSVPALNTDNAALQALLTDPDPSVQLTIANSLWLDQSNSPVLPSFMQTDETYYGATVGDLAGAPDNVNAWVDSETQGLIPTLLPPGQYQDAIIANVLYFKAQWTTAFDSSDTASAIFTTSGGSQVAAELMHQTGLFAYIAGTLHGSNFQAVRIPYGQGRLSMLVVLPDVGANVTNFVAAITIDDVNGWIAQLQSSTVSLALPRFTASYGASLTRALSSMGMGITFGPSADFAALAPGFFVNVVEHKTVVEVDETGTVAAAATGAGTVSAVTQRYTMTMDHPFFYAIRDDKTGELLFIGVLMNPT